MTENNMESRDAERNTELVHGRSHPSPPEESGGVSTDEILDVLADDRRRHVLSYLRDAPHSVVSRGELASFVRRQVLDGASEEQIAIDLHHTALPKLDDAGLLDYDPRSATVDYRVHPRVERYLDEIGERG